MKINRFYEHEELQDLGFKSIGHHVRIAKTVTIDDPSTITIGHHTLINDYCTLTGTINIGSFTHIAHYVHLSGTYDIDIGNFVGIGSRSILYTSNDSYKGDALWTPTHDEFRKPEDGPIVIKDQVLTGVYCLILPNVYISSGAVFEARCTLIGRYFGDARWGPRVNPRNEKIETKFIVELKDYEMKFKKIRERLLKVEFSI